MDGGSLIALFVLLFFMVVIYALLPPSATASTDASSQPVTPEPVLPASIAYKVQREFDDLKSSLSALQLSTARVFIDHCERHISGYIEDYEKSVKKYGDDCKKWTSEGDSAA